jgi:uncharacterized protein with WD repeat
MSTTIKDVAKLATVSTATVSRVLNGTAKVSGEIRTRVLTAVSRLQYHPNAHAAELGRARGSGLSEKSRAPVRAQVSKKVKPSSHPRADAQKVHRQTGKLRLPEDDWTRLRSAIAELSEDDLETLRSIIQ